MNIREMDELYTKFLAVTGLPAEKIFDLFLAGYTLAPPAQPICLEVVAEGFDIEREYTRLKKEMQAAKAENRRWGQVCEAQNKRIEQLEKELGLPAVEMTRRLFEAGQISMESLRLLLTCSEQARWSILHDYPSLYRFA